MMGETLFQREIPPLEYLRLDILYQKRLFHMLGQNFLFQEFRSSSTVWVWVYMPTENLVVMLINQNSTLNSISMNTEVHDYNFLVSASTSFCLRWGQKIDNSFLWNNTHTRWAVRLTMSLLKYGCSFFKSGDPSFEVHQTNTLKYRDKKF